MPYLLDLQPGETLVTEIDFRASPKAEPFRFAVTDQALHLPAKRFVVAGDPRYFKRVPLSEVDEVRIEAVRPYGFYLAAVCLAGPGILFLAAQGPPTAGIHPETFGLGLALLAGGVLLPFAGRGRRRLIVRLTNGAFRWTPPLVVDPTARRQVNEVLDEIAAACASASLRVVDTRKEPAGPTS